MPIELIVPSRKWQMLIILSQGWAAYWKRVIETNWYIERDNQNKMTSLELACLKNENKNHHMMVFQWADLSRRANSLSHTTKKMFANIVAHHIVGRSIRLAAAQNNAHSTTCFLLVPIASHDAQTRFIANQDIKLCECAMWMWMCTSYSNRHSLSCKQLSGNDEFQLSAEQYTKFKREWEEPQRPFNMCRSTNWQSVEFSLN